MLISENQFKIFDSQRCYRFDFDVSAVPFDCLVLLEARALVGIKHPWFEWLRRRIAWFESLRVMPEFHNSICWLHIRAVIWLYTQSLISGLTLWLHQGRFCLFDRLTLKYVSSEASLSTLALMALMIARQACDLAGVGGWWPIKSRAKLPDSGPILINL